MEGETEMGAAILDGPRSILVPEHDHRVPADLRQEPTFRAEVVDAAGERFHALIVEPTAPFVNSRLVKYALAS